MFDKRLFIVVCVVLTPTQPSFLQNMLPGNLSRLGGRGIGGNARATAPALKEDVINHPHNASPL